MWKEHSLNSGYNQGDMARTTNDLRALAGQLLTFGFDGTELTAPVARVLQERHAGGIILFARNIENPRQTHALLKAAQKLSPVPLFRCVDMEGGTVDRLKNVVSAAPSAQEVFAAGGKAHFRQHGALIGAEVQALGFNVDFAPVLDLRQEVSTAVMGSRTVGDAKATVSYARGFLAGLKSSGISGCGKHFPGLGEGAVDSHLGLPVVRKPWKALWNEDLVPYRELAGSLPMVMVAHCAYSAVTGEGLPASISRKWIDGVLRKKIGYKGLVVSDDLEMGGVLKVRTIEEAAVETIAAGADIYLVCHNLELVDRAGEAILKEAERSKVFREKVTVAAGRVLAAKKRWASLKAKMAPVPSEATIHRLRQKLWALAEEVRLTAAGRA